MKIAVMTFYQRNYGAVLQTWALQIVLKKMGHTPCVIDCPVSHAPRWRSFKTYVGKTFSLTREKWRILFQWWVVKKPWNRRMDRVLEKTLKSITFTSRRFSSLEELQRHPPPADVYICGSDQVWNCNWLEDTRYFLDFGQARRIAYAASFGFSHLPADWVERAKNCLKSFSAISVREESACKIVHELNFQSTCVADPTLLLTADEYKNYFLKESVNRRKSGIFSMVLHKNQYICLDLIDAVRKKYDLSVFNVTVEYEVKGGKNELPDLDEWLGACADADVVVTNSYHAVIFSLLFHKPFLVCGVEGHLNAMNERLITLLKLIGLENRFIIEVGEIVAALDILDQPIDWRLVDEKIATFRRFSLAFLEDALEKTKK